MEIEIPAEISADDLETFPDAGYRYELHEGNLVLMSPVTIWHNNAAWRLIAYFRAQGRYCAGEVGIKFGGRDVRTPDVSVFHRKLDDSKAMFPPAEFALVVEIVSISTEIDDRVTKPWVYAHAGIPEFWRVERIEGTDDGTIHQFTLGRSAEGEPVYQRTGETTLSALEKGTG